MSRYPELAVVVPISPADRLTPELSQSLKAFEGAEIILALSAGDQREFPGGGKVFAKGQGRAVQLNAALRAAKRSHVLVLHADSRVSEACLDSVAGALKRGFSGLCVFRLGYTDGSPLLRVNAWGANWRTAWLKLPFGDQGFLFSRELWSQVGGFDESAPYGEDHLFVWKVRGLGKPIQVLPATLGTSGRKYTEYGWARTTLQHGLLTWRQALPEILRLGRNKAWPR